MHHEMFHCCIDPGHGGETDPFRVSPHYHLSEAAVNLAVARRVAEILQGAPTLRWSLSRTEDVPVALEVRVSQAKKMGAHLFVSIHHNMTALRTKGMHHPMVFVHQPHAILSPRVRDLATQVLTAFQTQIRFPHPLPLSYPNSGLVSDQWVYPEGMAVLRGLHRHCPSVITEAGFLSDASVEEAIYAGVWVDEEAHAIASVIQNIARTPFALVTWAPVVVQRDGFQIRLSGRIECSCDVMHLFAYGIKNLEWEARRVQPGECTFEVSLTLSQFLEMDAIGVHSPAVYPDVFPVVFPEMRIEGDLHSIIWPNHVQAAVKTGAYHDEIMQEIRWGLKIFPNHPWRIEALAYIAAHLDRLAWEPWVLWYRQRMNLERK